MAAAAKKLGAELGDVVEIGGRCYDVVPDRQGGVALEPTITRSVADIHREHGGRPLTPVEFDELSPTRASTAKAESPRHRGLAATRLRELWVRGT